MMNCDSKKRSVKISSRSKTNKDSDRIPRFVLGQSLF